MYYLFRHKKIRPAEYYEMGPGEKRVLHAFAMQEVEDIKEAMKNRD